MQKKLPVLNKFLRWSVRSAGKPITFVMALAFLVVWITVGFYLGFSNTWLLILTSIATINASLMVFIIQNTQSRESKALNLKLDGLISAIKEAENTLIAIEDATEEELDQIRKIIRKEK